MLEKLVLTGGPGVGKTTTLRELEKLGYPVIPEAARQVIEEEQRKPDGMLPADDMYVFQCKVYQRQLALERQLKDRKDGIIQAFLDRSLIDAIAYHRFYRTPLPPELPILAQDRYRHIFILDPLPAKHYEKDGVRTESPKTAKAMHDLILQTYRDYGYVEGIDLTRVPVLPAEARARHIISTLEHPERW
jgi:predicted ATPase